MTYVPRGRDFEEFTVGETFTTAARTVTEGAVDRFAGLSGDFNPSHTDEESPRQGLMTMYSGLKRRDRLLRAGFATVALHGGLGGSP